MQILHHGRNSSKLLMKRVGRLAAPLLRSGNPWIRSSVITHQSLCYTSPTVFTGARAFSRPYSSEQFPLAKACPSCGATLNIREISCGKCRTLSPLPEDVNYLSLFGLPSTKPFEFNIDLGKLRREYLKLMSKVHPDSVIGKSEVRSQLFYPLLI